MGGNPMMPLDPTGKIRRTVEWINANKDLAEPLHVDQLVERLSEVDLAPALRILKDVEENHASIKNPTNFVLAASNRLPKGGMTGMFGPWGHMLSNAVGSGGAGKGAKRQWKENAAAPGDDEESKKISKEVGRLNREIGFHEKLSYSDVKEHLEAVGVETSLKILQDLRVAAPTVKSPTSYVIVAAKRAAQSGGAYVPTKRARGPDPMSTMATIVGMAGGFASAFGGGPSYGGGCGSSCGGYGEKAGKGDFGGWGGKGSCGGGFGGKGSYGGGFGGKGSCVGGKGKSFSSWG